MEITIKNRKSDFTAYYDYLLKETEEGIQIGKRAFIYQLWFKLLIMALLFALIWGARGYLGYPIQSSFSIAIRFIVFVILLEGINLLTIRFNPYYYYGMQSLKQNVSSLNEKDLQILQQNRTIKLDDKWLEIQNPESLHRWRWDLVNIIGMTSSFIFLRAGQQYLLCIPKRDFPSEENFLEFGEKINKLNTKNKNQSFALETKN